MLIWFEIENNIDIKKSRDICMTFAWYLHDICMIVSNETRNRFPSGLDRFKHERFVLLLVVISSSITLFYQPEKTVFAILLFDHYIAR